MLIKKRSASGLICFLAIIGFFPQAYADKKIALSFDDAPRPDTSYFTGEERTALLLENLKKVTAPPVTMFVTANSLSERTQPRIDAYVWAGLLIANHSHAHKSANKLSVNDFVQDTELAHASISRLDNFTPFYRFPYLHEGDTVEKRDAMRTHLSTMGYRNGYVTVDNFDWYMDAYFQELIRAEANIDMAKLGELYVQSLIESVEFYDDLAVKTLNRRPSHVLLLHENDLAAMYVDDLIVGLRAKGWKIITTTEAYEDEMASIAVKSLFSKQGRVAQIAVDNGEDESIVRSPYESEGYVKALLNGAVIEPK